MRHWIVIVAALACVGIGSVGCQKDRDHDMDDMDHTPTTMSSMSSKADCCPHCPGIQTATADGKCPVCGMPVAVR